MALKTEALNRIYERREHFQSKISITIHNGVWFGKLVRHQYNYSGRGESVRFIHSFVYNRSYPIVSGSHDLHATVLVPFAIKWKGNFKQFFFQCGLARKSNSNCRKIVYCLFQSQKWLVFVGVFRYSHLSTDTRHCILLRWFCGW